MGYPRTPTVRQGMEQVITKRRYYDIGLQIEELLYSG
ncbi:GntR family transcriptional regulator, partial [Escherichia coli]|nr:GntR family transcriptional regulator [Escherichia coli]